VIGLDGEKGFLIRKEDCNLGFQDVHNLAWKLAYVLQGKGKKSLLDTYQQERQHVKKSLVYFDNRTFRLTANENPILRAVQFSVGQQICNYLLKLPKFRQFIFQTISQTGIKYKTSQLSKFASYGVFLEEAADPGDRLPYILYKYNSEKKENMQDLVDGKSFSLFVFSGESKKFIQKITLGVAQYEEIINAYDIPNSYDTRRLYQVFGIKETGIILIRPDMYIGYRSNGFSVEHFHQYLNQYFSTKPH
jgi:hypothetical protein